MSDAPPKKASPLDGVPAWLVSTVTLAAAALFAYRNPSGAAAGACLGVLIFVHELGHFTVAKWQGMRVEMFSIGFGPALIKVERGGTVYQLAAFPLGGFVKPAGEDPQSDEDIANAKPDEFMGRPWWSRGVVIWAGPLTNLIFPLVMMFLVYATVGRPYPWGPPQVTEIVKDSGAEKAGMKLEDLVVKINGVPVNNPRVLAGMVDKASRQTPEQPLTVDLLRQGQPVTLKVRTQLNGEAGRYLMGVRVDRSTLAYSTKVRTLQVITPAEKSGLKKGDVITEVGGVPLKNGGAFASLFAKAPSDPVNIVVQRGPDTLALAVPKKQPIPETWADPEQVGLVGLEFEPAEGDEALKKRDKLDLKQAFFAAVDDTRVGIFIIVFGVKETVLGRIKAKDALGGPIAIMRMAKQQADKGWDDLFNLMVNISLTLGLMNLLPIPILDGGTLVFCAIEGLMRKPVKLKTQAAFQNVGMALLMGLLAFTLINDISRLFTH